MYIFSTQKSKCFDKIGFWFSYKDKKDSIQV